MEPQSSDNILRDDHLRLLILGAPKAGKTSVVAATAPKPIYFINSDGGDSLKPAARMTKEFSHNLVQKRSDMEAAIKIAYDLAKADKIKTVCWDTLSEFSDYLADELNVNDSAWQGWQEYHKYLRNVINRLKKIKAHLIVVAHYENFTTEEGQKSSGVEKVWKPGRLEVVPELYGKSRRFAARAFNDAVFLEKNKDGSRTFVTNANGVYGPGCRNLKSQGFDEMPADIGQLIKRMEKSEC